MEPTAQSALIVAIVAVVLGGIGLIGGILGYVQGMNAVARAGHARQRAVVAEEEALQARAAAESTARAAEELLDRIRGEAARGASATPSSGSVPSTMAPPTVGSALLPPTSGATPQPPSAAPPAATRPATVPPETAVVVTPPTVAEAVPPVEPAVPEDVTVVPAERQPAEHFSVPLPVPPSTAESAEDGPVTASDDVAEAESTATAAAPGPEAQAPEPVVDQDEPPADPREPEPAAGTGPEEDTPPAPSASATEQAADTSAPRDDRGRVVAGAQDAPTMDWAEVLRTGAIPLPSISRGTYAAPRRRPRPTGEGPARFELRAVGRQRFEAVNVGGEPAEDARVEGGGEDPHLVRPLSSRPSTVPPAGALAFSMLRVEGRHASVAVVWTRDGESVQQELPLD